MYKQNLHKRNDLLNNANDILICATFKNILIPVCYWFAQTAAFLDSRSKVPTVQQIFQLLVNDVGMNAYY